MGSFALMPIGFALAGWAIQAFGAPLVFIVGGAATALMFAAALFLPEIRKFDEGLVSAKSIQHSPFRRGRMCGVPAAQRRKFDGARGRCYHFSRKKRCMVLISSWYLSITWGESPKLARFLKPCGFSPRMIEHIRG